MRLQTRLLIPALSTFCMFLMLGTSWASECITKSTTSVHRLTADPEKKDWLVEFSKTSISQLDVMSVRGQLKATMLNLKQALDNREEVAVESVGFIWRDGPSPRDCTLYRVADGNIDQDVSLTIIESDLRDSGSCHDNATLLKDQAFDMRATAYAKMCKDTLGGPFDISIQRALAHAIVSGHLTQYDANVAVLPTIREVAGGYRVKDGDTLSAIAHKFTGNAANWTQLRVLSRLSGEEASDRNDIHPNDTVYFPQSVELEYYRSILPSYLYESPKTSSVRDILRATVGDMPTGTDSLASAFMTANSHILREQDGVTVAPRGSNVWIPQVVVGWEEVKLVSYNPLEIAKNVYRDKMYETLVATICPRHVAIRKMSCTLPILDTPSGATQYWDWWRDIGKAEPDVVR